MYKRTAAFRRALFCDREHVRVHVSVRLHAFVPVRDCKNRGANAERLPGSACSDADARKHTLICFNKLAPSPVSICAVQLAKMAEHFRSSHLMDRLISPHSGHALPQPMLDVVGFVTAAAGL